MCVILLGCVQIWDFYRTLFRGLLFSGHSVEFSHKVFGKHRLTDGHTLKQYASDTESFGAGCIKISGYKRLEQ